MQTGSTDSAFRIEKGRGDHSDESLKCNEERQVRVKFEDLKMRTGAQPALVDIVILTPYFEGSELQRTIRRAAKTGQDRPARPAATQTVYIIELTDKTPDAGSTITRNSQKIFP